MEQKTFSGNDLVKVIQDVDTWLIDNHASLYGSKPMIKREGVADDGQTVYELTVSYIIE